MSKRRVQAVYPLSPLQEGMLFHSVRGVESDAYQTQVAIPLREEVDPDFWRDSWRDAVDRHGVLRTAFQWEGVAEPVQVVVSEAELEFSFYDWRGESEERQPERLRTFLREDRRRKFDLTRAPLMRVSLIRVEEEGFFHVWTFHHMILDGWSTAIVQSEVHELYQARAQSREAVLPTVRPFRDYIAWLAARDSAKAKLFWQEYLKGFTSATSITQERSRSTPGRDRFAKYEIRLSRATTRSLQDLARTHRVTLNSVALGAWALMISRSVGEKDVVFGVVSSGRSADLDGVESIVGLLMNTLPFRVIVDPRRGLRDWLSEVQAQHSRIDEFGFAPLVKVQSWSEVPAGGPLFESLFVFEPSPFSSTGGSEGGPEAGQPVSLTEWNNYPLTVVFLPGDEIAVRVLYSVRHFESEAVQRMLARLERLLEQFTNHSDQRIGCYSILTESESRSILSEWNRESTFSSDLSVHRVVEAQSRRTPDAVAVVDEERLLSYGELERRASRLADRLQSSGVRLETRVGIMMERSADLVVALLAVLKAGGAYLPLDPRFPEERIGYMLKDSSVSVVVVDPGFRSRLAHLGAELVCVADDLWVEEGAPSLEPSAPDGVFVVPENAAYVIYTSGSTGKPKGVEVTHGNVVRLFEATREFFEFGAGDVWTLFHSYAFDFSVWEGFGALFHGGRLVIVPSSETSAPEEFLERLQRHSVTVLNQTPTAFHELVRVEGRSSGARLALRAVVFGGEALAVQRLIPWFERHGDQSPELINMYGITETTVHVTYHRVMEGEARSGVVSPIGRAISDLQAYVVDESGNLAGIGVPGELYVGGLGLARGYQRRPGLTAERFVPDPFGRRSGSRLYRSGDVAVWDSEGTLGYRGRNDSQIKVRGYRVEAGEIEGALEGLGAIRSALVLSRADGDEPARLVAYLVCEDCDPPSVSELRAHLAESLPSYMVPALFLFCESFPLTPSGKIDRQALPDPQGDRPELEIEFVAPSNEVQRKLVEIWSRVLRVERVGIHDDFFGLGGDSIMSLQVAARAREERYRITPNQIFQHPTVAQLASVIDPEDEIQRDRGPAGGKFPLTPIQRWFFEQDLADPHHFNQALMLEVAEDLSDAEWKEAVTCLVECHDALRLRFAAEVGGWTQEVVRLEDHEVFSVLDLTRCSEREEDGRIRRETARVQASLDLESGPLLRLVLIRRGDPRPSLLCFVVHHLAVDAVSWGILLGDLETLLRQVADDVVPKLPSKTTSYQAWSEALVRHVESGGVDDEAAFWLETAERGAGALEDRASRGPSTVEMADSVTVELGAEKTLVLLQEASKTYRARVDEVLCAALAQGAKKSGQQSLWIHLEGHGREEIGEEIDLSRTVGWFTAMYPICLNAEGLDEPGELMKSIKEQLRRVPRRGIGYGLLGFRHSDQERRNAIRAKPGPETVFNYLGRFDAGGSDSLFRNSSISPGPMLSGRGRRSHGLEINALVTEGRLRVTWIYDTHSSSRGQIEDRSRNFMESLEALISHCRTRGSGSLTPSDFPLAALDSSQLQAILGRFPEPEDIYPVSSTQHGMLLFQLFNRGTEAYVNQASVTLEGLDVESYRRAWQVVVDRNAVFRTAFLEEGLRRPLQVVVGRAELHWEEHDWTEVSEHEFEPRFLSFLEKERKRPLPFDQPPLMRFVLIRRKEGKYQFVWTWQHVLFDGWCFGPIYEEVFSCYDAFRSGEHYLLPTRRPFRDFIAWLEAQDLEKAESFWRRNLRGFVSPTRLAMDREPIRFASGDETYDEEWVELSPRFSGSLTRFAARSSLTLNSLINGAWAMLLSQFSGEDDVLFGATVSGRPPGLEGVESMIGIFINTLPVRVRVRWSERLVPWLKELQSHLLEISGLQYTPLTEVPRWSDLPAGVALFESLVVFENYPIDNEVMDRSEALQPSTNGFNFGREVTSYPLMLLVVPGDRILLRIGYQARRFRRDDVRGLLSHLRRILGAMERFENRALSEFPSLGPVEQEEFLAGATGSESPIPVDRGVHHLFEEQATRRPDATAIIFGEHRLSYRGVNIKANGIAHRLRGVGVGPEVPVGVYLERSADLVLGLLAILKVGGFYVPLDPDYPEERLGFVVSDSMTRVVLTTLSLSPRLSRLDSAMVCLDQAAEESTVVGSDENPSVGFAGSSAAYLLYTSGSTGAPKGVLVSHASLLNHCLATVDLFELTEDDVVLQFASMSFDTAAEEIFPTMAAGAALMIRGEALSPSGPQLVRRCAEEMLTVVDLPTAYWHQMIHDLISEGVSLPPSLRLVILGGERVDPASLRRWRSELGRGRRLLNTYGPTEGTIIATCAELDGSGVVLEEDDDGEVPIGSALRNVGAYVMDSSLRPARVAVTGELHLGGALVARGYWRRPGLTAACFVPDPLGSGSGQRVYRTRDRVRQVPNGWLWFVGRRDHQVKLRGIRIELEEVEWALGQHPSVRDAAVIVSSEDRVERLVAFIVGTESTSSLALRKFLKVRLPSFMIPAQFFYLDAFPLTSRNKRDREALSRLISSAVPESSDFVAPGSETEKTIAEIWRRELEVARVGVHESFFDLGGSSLQLLAVGRAIEKRLHVEVAFRDFLGQTLGQLAKTLERRRKKALTTS